MTKIFCLTEWSSYTFGKSEIAVIMDALSVRGMMYNDCFGAVEKKQ